MNQEKHQLFSEFEKEVWLYLDKSLSDDRMSYWEEKLKQYPELKVYIEDYENMSASYNNASNVDLSAIKFNSMIDNAISKKTYSNRVLNIITNIFSSEQEVGFGKIAFASVLIIGAIAISLISNRSNPVVRIAETINSEILDWDPDFVDNQIDKVGTLLRVAKDDDYRKYYKYRLTTNNVDKNINLINNNIQTLKEELNSKEL